MALFELVGRRWTLRIIWELHQAPAPLTFRALRNACDDISSSVLTRRLADLTEARIVTSTGSGYALTDEGRELEVSLEPLLDWSKRWALDLDH